MCVHKGTFILTTLLFQSFFFSFLTTRGSGKNGAKDKMKENGGSCEKKKGLSSLGICTDTEFIFKKKIGTVELAHYSNTFLKKKRSSHASVSHV